MKRIYLILCLLLSSGTMVFSQIVDIPDAAFKDTLVNDPVVDFDMDGVAESDVDTNDDGEIQVSEALAVEVLITVGQNIVRADGIEAFANLKTWFCSYNEIEALDMSQNLLLEELVFAFNEVEVLDISQNNLLTRLDTDFNHLETLDVSHMPNLERLWVSFNDLTELDVTQNTLLKNLNVDSNELTSIDLSNNTQLELFAIDQNNLTEIDLSNSPELFFVDVYGNQLETLDLSNNPNVEVLTCLNNNLTSLNIRNGNNIILETFNALNNPNLGCIEVDDVPYANSRDDWQIDDGIIFSENCLLSTESFAISGFDIVPNPANSEVWIQANTAVDESTSWEISDSLGRTVFSKNGTLDNFSIAQWPTGLYFVSAINSKGETAVRKLIKQ